MTTDTTDLEGGTTEVEILRDWLSDADLKVDSLRRHLRAVIEIARTWQPDYATQMDRNTLAFAAEAARQPSEPKRNQDAQ